ncbi:MAG: ComF family protein [Saprospiraceae bacterium]|nr:ComF family protein [Saprospiraceae bacterium]
MINKILSPIYNSFLDLLFPNLCIHCGLRTHSAAEIFCIGCQKIQNPTDLHLFLQNEFTAHFTGRIPIFTGASLYYYNPGGLIHSILDRIKYKGYHELATRLGDYYGEILKESPHYKSIDIVTAVPIHSNKENIRGYNQSAIFARAVANKLNLDFEQKIINKIRDHRSQTEKSRIERMNNILNSFEYNKKYNIQNRNILLVDDVLTTGATLEACAIELLKGNPKSISMITIAMGKN